MTRARWRGPFPQVEQALAVLKMIVDAGGDPELPVQPLGAKSYTMHLFHETGVEDLIG